MLTIKLEVMPDAPLKYSKLWYDEYGDNSHPHRKIKILIPLDAEPAHVETGKRDRSIEKLPLDLTATHPEGRFSGHH